MKYKVLQHQTTQDQEPEVTIYLELMPHGTVHIKATDGVTTALIGWLAEDGALSVGVDDRSELLQLGFRVAERADEHRVYKDTIVIE